MIKGQDKSPAHKYGFKNLKGKRFGKLLVKREDHTANAVIYWRCLCDCGKVKVVPTSGLRGGHYHSCGCEHWKKGNINHTWRGHGEIGLGLWNHVKHHAENRGHRITITIEFAWALFLKQNRMCAMTGRKLVFGSRKLRELITASLDQIVPGKGYVKGNVQWVHKDINKMMMNFSKKYFVKTCCEVADHSRKKK